MYVMDLDTVLLVLMFICIGIMAVTAVTDRMFFYYKKTPGRGYAQIAKPNVPKQVVSIYSSLELVGFLGFCICIGLLAWRMN